MLKFHQLSQYMSSIAFLPFWVKDSIQYCTFHLLIFLESLNLKQYLKTPFSLMTQIFKEYRPIQFGLFDGLVYS